MSFTPPSVNYIYHRPIDSSELTRRNKNRMLYANYITKIQDNNVGCDTARTGLENGQVASGSIIPDLIEGARFTTQEQRDLILGINACQFPIAAVPPVVIPAFNPAPYGDLQLWLDAADVTGTGTNPADGSLTTWVNKSGAASSATAFGSPTLNATGLNGKPALLLNGSMGYRGTLTNSGTVVTVFAVVTLNSLTTTYGRLVSLAKTTGTDADNSESCIPLLRDLQTANIAAFRNGGVLSTKSTAAYNTGLYTTSIFDGTNNTVYVNGVAATIPVAQGSGNFAITKYGFGMQPNVTNGDFWEGYLSELLIYNTALSSTNQKVIENYLATKWGIA